MLFNGEAIFGGVVFRDAAGAGKCRADALLRRVRDLGLVAQYRSYGRAFFGVANSSLDAKDVTVASESDGVHALAMGEVCLRGQAEELLRAEPQRSRFLAEGYRTDGTRFLDQLDGTFAAVFWDAREERLALMCDRRADAHLYYQLRDGEFVFSSWLRLLGDARAEIDRHAVQEFLRFLYISPPRTIFRGISRLEPGRYATAFGGCIQTAKLPSANDSSGAIRVSQDSGETLKKFDALVQDAVRRRIGQRRVGMFLSSGVDSATLTAVCQRVNPGQVEAFTVGFADEDLDETKTARSMAQHIGVPHTELRFGLKQYRRAFDLLANGFDQPFGDPAGLPLILACESAKTRVDVISGGVGGDDLFGAPIPRHLWFSTAFSARLPDSLRAVVAAALRRSGLGLSGYASIFDFDEVEELFVTWAGWSKRELQELVGKKVSFETSGFYRAFRENKSEGTQKLYDALAFFPPDDCRFEAAALSNVPVEMPYHDASLNSYVRNLPERFRSADGMTKILLRQLFNQYFPAQLLSAKKHYFNIPLQAVLADADYELVKQYLAPEHVERIGLVDSSKLQPWLSRFLAGDESLRFKVWALLVLHAWVGSRN